MFQYLAYVRIIFSAGTITHLYVSLLYNFRTTGSYDLQIMFIGPVSSNYTDTY